MSTISVSKWFVMGGLTLGSVLLGVLPYFLLRKLKGIPAFVNVTFYNLVLTVLSCTGGGVLLATTLVHMLPENRLSLEGNSQYMENFDDHLPMAEILTIVGFLMIYILEEVATWVIQVSVPGHSEPESDLDLRRTSVLSIHAMSRKSIQYQSDLEAPPSTPVSTSSKTELHVNDPVTTKAHLGTLFALAALSFHAVMEGMAIGIQNSSNLWLLFGAIASHKFVISFCMGMELCAAKAKPKVYAGSIFLFAILSPIGILIGSFLTEENSNKSLPVSVLEGLTTGTLLYVVFFEILARERQRRQDVMKTSRLVGLYQLIGVIVGTVGMICLLTLIDHGHNVVTPDLHLNLDQNSSETRNKIFKQSYLLPSS